MIPVVDVDARDAVRFFADRVAAVEDLRPAYRAVIDDFHERQAEVFATQGASQGTPWKPLKSSWLRERQRQGKGSQLLRFSSSRGGLMYRSLTQRGAQDQIADERPDELRIGTRVGIARAHQDGMNRVSRGRRLAIPARPLVAIDRKTSDRWAGLLLAHLVGDDGR